MTPLLLARQCMKVARRPRAAIATLELSFPSGHAADIGSAMLPAGCSRSPDTSSARSSFENFKKLDLWEKIESRRQFFSSAASSSMDDDDGDHDEQSKSSTIPFLLADIGEGIKEVEILQWFVQVGDSVQQFDRICEVQSDKATVEITSRYDGVVDSLSGGNVGDMVQVGEPLLFIQVQGGASDHDDGSESGKEQVLHSQDSADNQLHIPHVASQFHLDSDDDDKGDGFGVRTGAAGKFLATPAVRKLGMEHNLDLSTLVGTGPQGRVLKADVLTFLRESGRISSPSPPTAGEVTTVVKTAPAPGVAVPSKALLQDEMVTLKGYNRLMIQTMTASQEIPHMGYTDEFDISKLTEYRKDLSPKVAILAFFIKATSLALKEHPMVNASWKDIDKGQVTMWVDHNIGVAMDTPRGLVVPVIRQCQDKSLVEIQDDLEALKEIAAAGKLAEEHLTGATFTLSNIGSVGGGTYMNPLIVPPQAAIGAMGSMRTLPRFDSNGNVTAAKIINMSWAGDHRMIDGATLARFSNLCKEYLQDPVRMLVAMK